MKGKFVVEQTIKDLISQGKTIKGASVGVLGLTFKENCPDLRNSRVTDVIDELRSYHTDVFVCDPLADVQEAKEEYQIQLSTLEQLPELDAVILCVAHQAYVEMDASAFQRLLKQGGIVFDVKAALDRQQFAAGGIPLYRL